jgi:hypothetical protein
MMSAPDHRPGLLTYGIIGALALVAAGWLLRRRLPSDRFDEAVAFAGRLIQRGEDIGPRPLATAAPPVGGQ